MRITVQIFLSYVRSDRGSVEKLYQNLSDAGFRPWMDAKDILPGERWESAVRRAIRNSHFFLACLSANSVNRRGFLQKEINDALDIWREMLDSDIYLIPVRLEDCAVPECLRDFQWVNLFEEDGWTRLVRAIQVGMERRTEGIRPIVQKPAPLEHYPVEESPERVLFKKALEKALGEVYDKLIPLGPDIVQRLIEEIKKDEEICPSEKEKIVLHSVSERVLNKQEGGNDEGAIQAIAGLSRS